MSNSQDENMPSGSGLQMLRLLREIDDSHAPELERGQTHGVAWKATLSEALSRQLRAINITGRCSLDFFLHGWMRNAVLACHGEKVWSTLSEKVEQPDLFETSPLFDIDDWKVYAAQRAGVMSLPHALMGFAMTRLEQHACQAQDDEETRDDAPDQQQANAPQNTTARNTATPNTTTPNTATRNTTTPNTATRNTATHNSNVSLAAAPANYWEPIHVFMDNSFVEHMNSRGWSGFQHLPGPWCVPMPHHTEWENLGDPASVGILLDYVDLVLGTSNSGVRFAKVSVPDWAWRRDDIGTAWTNGSVRSAWLRKMWRAYLLLWRFTLALRLGQGKGSLLDFLHGPMNTEENTHLAGMLEPEFEDVNRRLLWAEENNRPMYQSRNYQ